MIGTGRNLLSTASRSDPSDLGTVSKLANIDTIASMQEDIRQDAAENDRHLRHTIGTFGSWG